MKRCSNRSTFVKCIDKRNYTVFPLKDDSLWSIWIIKVIRNRFSLQSNSLPVLVNTFYPSNITNNPKTRKIVANTLTENYIEKTYLIFLAYNEYDVSYYETKLFFKPIILRKEKKNIVVNIKSRWNLVSNQVTRVVC